MGMESEDRDKEEMRGRGRGGPGRVPSLLDPIGTALTHQLSGWENSAKCELLDWKISTQPKKIGVQSSPLYQPTFYFDQKNKNQPTFIW